MCCKGASVCDNLTLVARKQLILKRIDVLFVEVLRLQPRSTLFPYTTLFRSPRELSISESWLIRPNARRSFLAEQTVRCKGRMGIEFRALAGEDRKSTRLNSSHVENSYAVFCLKKKRNVLQGCQRVR